jgi:hypothetical protein
MPPRAVTIVFASLLSGAGLADITGFAMETATAQIAATADGAQGESGIAGQVSIRPVRPHVTIGVPNLAPYQAKLRILDPSGRELTIVETERGGSFRIALPPGKYVLQPQSPGPYPRASEQTVLVSPKKFTQVHVLYDSGIR